MSAARTRWHTALGNAAPVSAVGPEQAGVASAAAATDSADSASPPTAPATPSDVALAAGAPGLLSL